jgi:hypothetical protein
MKKQGTYTNLLPSIASIEPKDMDDIIKDVSQNKRDNPKYKDLLKGLKICGKHLFEVVSEPLANKISQGTMLCILCCERHARLHAHCQP